MLDKAAELVIAPGSDPCVLLGTLAHQNQFRVLQICFI